MYKRQGWGRARPFDEGAVVDEALGPAGAAATWHDTLAALPPGPLLLIANEFLDALPIRQCVRRGAGWAERFVADGAFIEQPCPCLLYTSRCV